VGEFVSTRNEFFRSSLLPLPSTTESPVFQGDPLVADKTDVLLTHLLSCLHKIFLHCPASPSSSSFITKERFDTLLTPLVHQISNQVGGGAVFQRRVEKLLCPCVAQLAVAAGREDLWKPLNYQLLLKTRHKKAEVRYAVVVVLKEVYSRLGNEFMSLLPETIPFLAELLEDESEEVEQETRSLISTIETHVGESIQQYFT
jgi:U3 small nucleolar RNA-associated protein 10